MSDIYNLNITEIDNYLKRIFTLESELRDKDFKITMLEFELAMEKNLVQSIKEIHRKYTPTFRFKPTLNRG